MKRQNWFYFVGRVINECNCVFRTHVHGLDLASDEFQIETDLKQGNHLSSLLSNFKCYAAQGSKVLLVFTDGGEIVTQFTRDTKEVFTFFENGVREIALKLNDDKTKYMVVTNKPRTLIG